LLFISPPVDVCRFVWEVCVTNLQSSDEIKVTLTQETIT
jgi:hypothetical protein